MNSHPNSIPCLVALGLFAAVPVCTRAELLLSGLDERQSDNVRALTPLASTGCSSARWRVERLFRDADKSIDAALRALGYYDAAISKSLRWGDDCWQASFDIEIGEPVRLRDVDVEITGDAATEREFLQRIAAVQPRSGDVFDHGRYSDFKSSLLRHATNAGFFDADFEYSRVIVDKHAKSADLSMQFAAGDKYRFGDVQFTSGILRDSILRGYTDIKPGQPYSATMINELYEALNGSSYFSSVSIRTEPLDEDNKVVPVDVNLVPAKRRVYSVGGGFSTDLGPTGRIGYTNRRINDRGHQFESKLFGSSVKSEINAAYRWPKRDPRKEWFSIVSGFQHEKTDTSEQDSFKLGFLRSRNVGKNWLQTRYVDYTYEDFTVGEQSSNSQLIILGTNWETARGRALSRTTKGFRLSFDVRGASDSLGSDTSFLQFRSRAKLVRSLGEKTRVLARVSLGLTAKESLAKLPASVRFFAGGDNSVRGYDFETLGPVDDEGQVIGGSHLVDASVEIDRLFRDHWAVAAFVDAGDAFDDVDINPSKGVGVGLRWYSPVGPIRLDFAHPLDNPDEDFRIHISLGPDL